MSATPNERPSIFAPGGPIFYPIAAVAALSGIAFGGAAMQVGFIGTGATIPRGDGIVEGTLAAGRLSRSPAGDDFLVGEVTLGRPTTSTAIDHRWRGPAGDSVVVVQTADGDIRLRVPPTAEWRGRPLTDERVVEDLSGLPIVSTVDRVDAQLTPPYAIAVRALRPGDAVIARAEGGPEPRNALELYVGERADLEADLTARESMRFPIVGLMTLMALVSLLVSYRAFARARAT